MSVWDAAAVNCVLIVIKYICKVFLKYLHIFQCNCDPDDGPSSFLSSLQLVQKKMKVTSY